MNRLFFFFLLAGTAAFAAPWLGLSFKKTTYSNHLALDIKGVHPESGCFAVGITSGDTLIGVNGQTLTEMSQIQPKFSLPFLATRPGKRSSWKS